MESITVVVKTVIRGTIYNRFIDVIRLIIENPISKVIK